MSRQPVTGTVARTEDAPRSRTPVIAVWLSTIALALGLFLVVPYSAHRSPVLLLIVGLAIASGIAGIVFGLRARRSTSTRGGAALVCALVGVLITVVMAIIFVVGIVSASSINKVELRGQGASGISATFANDMEQRTVEWPAEGWAVFNTHDSWAELTVEAPQDAASKTVSCQIIWNGELVVDETSDRAVTCRYDAR